MSSLNINPKTCRMARREIDESEMNLRLSDQTQAHVASCHSCREFRGERTRLRELVGSLEPVTAPADFDMRLRARLAVERQRPARAWLFPQFLVSTPAMAAAAVIVLLAASVVWFTQRERNQPPAIAERVANSETATKAPDQQPTFVNKETNPNAASDATTKTAQQQDQIATGPNPWREINRKASPTSNPKTKTASREFAVEPAEVIKQNVDFPGQISLSAPDKPVVVSVEDNRGATHRILLPPVSFGAQRLVDNRVPINGTSNSRSW